MTCMLTYLAYLCIFGAYKCIQMHRRNTYGVTAYFHIIVYILCIFMHIFNLHIIAYLYARYA